MKPEIVVVGFGALCISVWAYLNRELKEEVGRVVLLEKPDDLNYAQIVDLLLNKIALYVGKVKIIAIFDPLATLLLQERLASMYPTQIFAYPSLEVFATLSDNPRKNLMLRRRCEYQMLKIMNEENGFVEYKWHDRDKKNMRVKECMLEGIREVLADLDKAKV